jgi:ribose transport system substrate-binding protein
VGRCRYAWRVFYSLLVLSMCAGLAQAADKPRVALVMKSLANEFFQAMQQGARAHQGAHAADYELLTTGIKDEVDTAGQIRLVQQMLTQHVDALVIAPADSKALVPVLQAAIHKGVVVINIDNRLDTKAMADKQGG